MKEDSLLNKSVKECYTNSGITILLHADGFETDFISSCIKNIQSNTEKKVDNSKLTIFCNCELDLIREHKITDAEMRTAENLNSFYFLKKCINVAILLKKNLVQKKIGIPIWKMIMLGLLQTLLKYST